LFFLKKRTMVRFCLRNKHKRHIYTCRYLQELRFHVKVLISLNSHVCFSLLSANSFPNKFPKFPNYLWERSRTSNYHRDWHRILLHAWTDGFKTSNTTGLAPISALHTECFKTSIITRGLTPSSALHTEVLRQAFKHYHQRINAEFCFTQRRF